VTFTTSTPANSACTVDYEVTSSWGTGYVASVTLSDTGPSRSTAGRSNFAFRPPRDFTAGLERQLRRIGPDCARTSASRCPAALVNSVRGGNTGAYPLIGLGPVSLSVTEAT